MPIAPAPITTSESGTRPGAQMASLFVQYGPSARPGIGVEVDLDAAADADAEAGGVAGLSRDLRAAEHHLRGDASVVVALAAELVAFGDRDLEVAAFAELEGDLR